SPFGGRPKGAGGRRCRYSYWPDWGSIASRRWGATSHAGSSKEYEGDRMSRSKQEIGRRREGRRSLAFTSSGVCSEIVTSPRQGRQVRAGAVILFLLVPVIGPVMGQERSTAPPPLKGLNAAIAGMVHARAPQTG